MKVYFGTPGWGWHLYGVGDRKHRWFLGLSIRQDTNNGEE